jgi:hypothetical protein
MQLDVYNVVTVEKESYMAENTRRTGCSMYAWADAPLFMVRTSVSADKTNGTMDTQANCRNVGRQGLLYCRSGVELFTRCRD